MKKNKKLKKALKSRDIATLNELKNDGYDFSKIDIYNLIDKDYSIEVLQFCVDSGMKIESKEKMSLGILQISILREKSINIIQLLLKNGADVNASYNMEPPLTLAVSNEKIDLIKLLIESGANINSANKIGMTPFMHALLWKYKNIIEILIQSGADINPNNKKFLPLNVAVEGGDINLVKLLIKNGADVNARDNYGRTALMVASVMGCQHIVKELLQNGINVNAQDYKGNTALMSAIFSDGSLVKLLIENGADLNIQNMNKDNALSMTLQPSKLTIYMLKNYKSSHQEGKKEITKELISKYEKVDLLENAKLLIENGAISDELTWHNVVMSQDIEWIKFIINNSDIDECLNHMDLLIPLSSYNHKDSYLKSTKEVVEKEMITQLFQDITPEMYLKIFELLADAGVDLNATNRYGHTFLINAIIHNNITIVDALLKHNVDVNLKSKTGFRAIDYAFDSKEIRTTLLKNGVKLNKDRSDEKFTKRIRKEINKTVKEATDVGGFIGTFPSKSIFPHDTFLSSAMGSGKIKDLKKAIAQDASLDVVNIVDLVLEDYGSKFIDTALKHGINKDRRDDKGRTALMHACKLGKKKIVKVLMKNGAAIDIDDNEGNDVWDHASLSGEEEILELLKNYDELSAPNHNPRELVKILSNFTRDTPMKYTTHDWDFGSINNTEHKDFKGFLGAIKKQWRKLEEELSELSPSLHKKVYNFLLNENKDTDGWFGKDNISIGWSSLDGLDSWCNDGNKPSKFNLDQSYIVDNKEISTFGDIINLFKQEIEIRKEHNMLEKIFIDIENELADNFSVETKHFREKNFYTDIQTFKEALSNIFSEIQKREFPEIQIKAIDETGDYIDISIIQIGSLAQQSSNNMLQEVENGNFQSIKELLINLCDWSIESSFEGENFRVNYLRSDKNILAIEPLDYDPIGFTYRLRFYK